MQIFLLTSMPLFLTHLLLRSGSHLLDPILRKSIFQGVGWAIPAIIIELILNQLLRQRIEWHALYLYALVNYYVVPLLFTIVISIRHMREFKKEGELGITLFQSQLAGFYSVYNIGFFFMFNPVHDQIVLLFIPLVFIFLLILLSRGLWRSMGFEIQWNVLQFIGFALLFCALPFANVFYGYVRPFWTWVSGVGILLLWMLLDLFFSRLETDIQYRLNLEVGLKPFIRLVNRSVRRG